MLRSSLRRSWSCAVTSRRCEARSSSTRRTLRRTRPACDARSRTRRSFDGFIGSLGGIATESAPRSSPRSRTSTTVSPSIEGRASFATKTNAAGSASVGHEAAGRSSAPRRSHTLAEPAPVAWPRICAMRPRTSSVAYDSPTRSENSVSTSYGVARLPYTTRSAMRRANRDTEQQRDDEHRARALVAGGDHAKEPDDGRVGRDHEQDEGAGDERLLHHDVELVQVVLQDGDRHGD